MKKATRFLVSLILGLLILASIFWCNGFNKFLL